MLLPALFLIDENGEAYHVMHFCNTTCRASYDLSLAGDTTKEGDSPDAIEGTQCEHCGKTIVESRYAYNARLRANRIP